MCHATGIVKRQSTLLVVSISAKKERLNREDALEISVMVQPDFPKQEIIGANYKLGDRDWTRLRLAWFAFCWVYVATSVACRMWSKCAHWKRVLRTPYDLRIEELHAQSSQMSPPNAIRGVLLGNAL